MAKKPTYEELEQKVKGLENEAAERKLVEEALRESEGKFRILSDQALLGIIILQEELFVYVNDRADVALVTGASGVHLGAEDLDPIHVRNMAPRPFRIGVSVGTEAEAAAVFGADVDYWSFGSIYHTDTKRDAGTPIGTDGFQRLSALAPAGMPVIAIGGIDSSNVGDVVRAGAHGVAVVSAVFGSPTVEKNARDLRAIIDGALNDSHSWKR